MADITGSRSRLLLTKTHVLYPPLHVLPAFQPCAVLGFKVVYHPLTSAKIKDSEISLRFLPNSHGANAPVIKAISPTPQFAATSQVSRTVRAGGSVNLGFTSSGAISLDASSETTTSFSTSASCYASGVETSHALFTLTEDPSSHGMRWFSPFQLALG